MLLVYDHDNSIEYHEIRDQHFFNCKLSDYYSFHIRIAFSYAFPNRKRRIVNNCTNGYIQHNHTKEVLEYNKNELEKRDMVKMEDRKAELINELDKAIKAPKTRILEYHNRVKNIKEKIKRIEKKSLHIDDKPILRVDIFMTDEYLNSICYNEDHLKEYVKAMRFHPVKVKIVRVLWYLKNGKADFRKSLKIDNDNYVPFSIPMITGEDESSLIL